MGRLDRVVLEVLMAGQDFLREGVRKLRANGLAWPDRNYLPHALSSLINCPAQPQNRRILADAIARRIASLEQIIGKSRDYTQPHLDIFLLAVLYDQAKIVGEYSFQRERAEADQWSFLVEEAVRHHVTVKFGVADEQEFHLGLYFEQIDNPGLFHNSSEYQGYFCLPEFRDHDVTGRDSSQLLDSAPLIEGSAESNTVRLVRDSETKLAEASKALVAKNLELQQAAGYRRKLEERVEEAEARLAKSDAERKQLSMRVTTLTEALTRIRKQNDKDQRDLEVAPKSLSDKRAAVQSAASRAVRAAVQTRGDPDVQRLLEGFTTLLKENRLVRGDYFCRRLRELRLCPPSWLLSTWNGRLTAREDTEEWQILLAEPPARSGISAREAHVLVASQCSISDELISMFDGCTGYGFDARVAQTLRPARIQLAAGNSFTVYPPKGEVSVK